MIQLFKKKFHRLKDGNIEAALKAVQKYYAYIYRNLDFLDGIKSQHVRDALNYGAFEILKYRFDGVVVSTFRTKYWKPKEVEFREMQLAMMYI